MAYEAYVCVLLLQFIVYNVYINIMYIKSYVHAFTPGQPHQCKYMPCSMPVPFVVFGVAFGGSEDHS